MNRDPYKGAMTGLIALVSISLLFVVAFVVAFVIAINTQTFHSYTGDGTDGPDAPAVGPLVGDR